MNSTPESGSRTGRTPAWWRVATTPLGDLARGRVTGPVARTTRARHGWPWDVRAAGFPAPVTDLILRVVAGTRLWRREKQDVARELIAHFQDGLEAGVGAADGGAELVRSFGVPRLAARLIRRAKRRNRPLLWQAWRRGVHAAGALLAIALLLYIWVGLNYWLRQPRIARNYAAELNAPVLARPESDRAWPLYVRAIGALEMTPRELQRHWGDHRPGDPGWVAALAYLDRNRPALDLIREGARRPTLGFVVSDAVPVDFDAAIRERWRRAGRPDWEPQPSGEENPALIGVLLPHLSEMRGFARLLSVDFHAAMEARDVDRASGDVVSLVRLAEHACDSPFVISDLVGLAIYGIALSDVGEGLRDHAPSVPDRTLIAWAHALSAFRGGGDLRPDLRGDRLFFEDMLQRVYTDDGRGDGRITAAGVHFLDRFEDWARDTWTDEWGVSPAMAPVHAAVSPGRRAIAREYDRCLTLLLAGYDRPLWEWDDRELPERTLLRLDRDRYRALHMAIPAARRVLAAGESAAQRRDGVLVAIALEAHWRRHGAWPDRLEALAPGVIPAVPPDRYDGRPLRFAIRDGRPVVYSIGHDRDDDGGLASPEPRRAGYQRVSPEEFGGPVAERHRDRRGSDGDWVLWPPPAREPLERDEPEPGAG